MLKLHKSEFIRLKQFKGAGFQDSDSVTIQRFLDYTSSLPVSGFKRQQAIVNLARKLEACKKQLTRSCDNASLNDSQWDSYRIAHRRLTGFLNLLNKHN